jgi:peptidyl-prolyl cis-trans isomerase B (cyclophilin B)
MSKHKLPTQVHVATTADKSEFAEFVGRWWRMGFAVALLIAGFVLVRQYTRLRADRSSAEGWDALRKELTFAQPNLGAGIGIPSAATLFNLGDRLRDAPAGAWARALEVKKRMDEADWAGASAALDALKLEHPDHALCRDALELEPGAAPMTLVARLAQLISARKTWRDAHPALFGNAALAADSPRVRITTSAGALVVQLAADRAPKHTENFLKLCSNGYYVGTKLHRVSADMMIQGGDPNSREGAVESWGLGGPDEKLDPESSGLFHFPWVLSTAKVEGDPKESGSQFFITVANAHHLDGKHSVFGVLVEGQDVARAIATAKVVDGTDRPESPVVIEKTERL